MELHMYPVLENHISISQVITPQDAEILLYNTVTGEKKFPNQATFNFLKLATGARSFADITSVLSEESGEAPEEIWPQLSTLADTMITQNLLKVSSTPFKNLRPSPPSVTLPYRLQSVSLEVTRKCNLRCKHCYSDSGTQLINELTKSQIENIIDQIGAMGGLSITFTGGEPLLHPDIFTLISYARKKPLSVLLFTNGTLVTPEIVEKLKKLQIYRINLSIDGPDAETHDYFRGVPGSFEKTVKAAKMFYKADIPVQAGVSVTKQNFNRIDEIIQLLQELHIVEYRLWPITFSGRPEEQDIFITLEEHQKYMQIVHDMEKNLRNGEKEVFEYTKKPENCGVGSGALSIKSNGVATPCPAFGEDMSVGNVREDSLIDIWRSSETLNMLRSVSVFEDETCKECQYAVMCKGGCIADVYRRTGEISCYDPYACESFKVSEGDLLPVEVDEKTNSLSVEIT